MAEDKPKVMVPLTGEAPPDVAKALEEFAKGHSNQLLLWDNLDYVSPVPQSLETPGFSLSSLTDEGHKVTVGEALKAFGAMGSSMDEAAAAFTQVGFELGPKLKSLMKKIEALNMGQEPLVEKLSEGLEKDVFDVSEKKFASKLIMKPDEWTDKETKWAKVLADKLEDDEVEPCLVKVPLLYTWALLKMQQHDMKTWRLDDQLVSPAKITLVEDKDNLRVRTRFGVAHCHVGVIRPDGGYGPDGRALKPDVGHTIAEALTAFEEKASEEDFE